MLILTASSGKNLALAQSIASSAIEQGIKTEIIDLCSLALPLYTTAQQQQGDGGGLDVLVEALQRHQGVIICAPEYNGSIPPSLSNAIAWLSVTREDFREIFSHRPVALASHSGGGGHRVMVAMRQQMAYLGCTVLGRELLATSQKPVNPESITAIVQSLHQLEQLKPAVDAGQAGTR
jgi:NAD(P)H-dependent FMN reductase